MYSKIRYTFEKAKVIVQNSEFCQVIKFLDVSVILHPDCTVETGIYYNDTDAHGYFPYDSAHPHHSRDNFANNLAKRIIVFVSNEEKTEYRLKELKNWLKSCKYPGNVINRAFRNARLQGPAPLKQIQIMFHLWQHKMTMLTIMKKLKKSVRSLMICNHIT